jgi:putative effector of murein hydrolase
MAAVSARRTTNDPRVVAAGVTVGVNAAAMGTAYLYEAHSEAAPHAALSMIALGIMTVVFSSIPPLAAWVVGRVAG